MGQEQTHKFTALKIGEIMPKGDRNAGWIYGGLSATTKAPFYIAAKDSGVFEWSEAMKYATKQNARLPSEEELDQLYYLKGKRALKGTFNVSGSEPRGWYFSSTQITVNADYGGWSKRFDRGHGHYFAEDFQASLRLVRS
jgi:hypothetical protein